MDITVLKIEVLSGKIAPEYGSIEIKYRRCIYGNEVFRDIGKNNT